MDGLLKKLGLLESEKANLSAQLLSLSVVGKQEEMLISEVHEDMEVLQLRRLNTELQFQKRNLCGSISTLESQLATLAKSDVVEEIKAEPSLLRHTNEDLCKQVEGLHRSRMNKVEELAYLRWVNSCLKDELHSCSNVSTDKPSSPNPIEKRRESICFSRYQNDQYSNYTTTTTTKKLNLIKNKKIKADVETQVEFVNSLIREVNNAVYQNIEDVVAFVKWLDDELCFLVDERAVLQHFEWPNKKADTLREAAFG
ncbi:hypothetical protein OROGR_000881 [Orobanche gracilis]